MAELAAAAVAIVLVSAEPRALDELVPPGHGARQLRVAPDEALFVADPGPAAEVARELADRIAVIDADALVLDVTDAWAAWTVRGDDVEHALSFTTALEVPADGGFVQGDVARVGATLLGTAAGVTILAPAYWGDHLRERLEDAIAGAAT